MRVERPVLERHPDQPQHGAHGGLDIATKQVLGGRLVDAVREPLPFVFSHHVAVADGRPAAGQK